MQKAKQLGCYRKFITDLETLLKPYIQSLQLAWPVEFYLPELHASSGLDVNLPQKEHRIIIDPYYLHAGSKYLHILCHLLCRARLAEINNPLFASTKIQIKPGDPDLGRKLDEFGIANHHVETWGYDLRDSLFPDLSSKDYEWFINQLYYLKSPTAAIKDKFIPIRRAVVQEESLQGILSAAQQQALAIRYHIKTEKIEHLLENFWSPPAMEELLQWINYYSRLPYLTGDIITDTNMLQRTVNEVVVSLELPIRPALYQMRQGECDIYFWTL